MLSVEVIHSFKSKGRYFCVVRHVSGQHIAYIRFGVSRRGHGALQKMFAFRPFDAMPGVKYQYFVRGEGGASTPEEQTAMVIHVIQARQGKNFRLEAPVNLIANLLWIARLANIDEASRLVIPEAKALCKSITWTDLLSGMMSSKNNKAAVVRKDPRP